MLLDKLRLFIKRRLFSKPGAAVPLLLFFLLLLLAGFLAITQESPDKDSLDPDFSDEDFDPSLFSDEEFEGDGEYLPVWAPPGPPRWFRSNAGGMTLEEIPSRIAALRNEYALVIDFLGPDELEPLLQPFYAGDYSIEIRVLYKEREEYRRQWLFRDEGGNTRLNAVFLPREAEDEAVALDASPDEPEPEELSADSAVADSAEPEIAEREFALAETKITPGIVMPLGFIEIFNEKARIARDYLFLEDGEEMLTSYFYNEGILVKAETERRIHGEDYKKIYTDLYRYNRSFSLRHVERLYHESLDAEPVRLLFPYRVLDAAANDNFITEKLILGSDFFGGHSVPAGFRAVYDTDSRGRILTQTLFDDKEQVVWVITNTWVGDRIAAIRKVEGDEEWLTEYGYNGEGNRVEQRDIRNGELERLVRIDGDRETEELYMNGNVVLRAFWEDGRKISEERVRSPARAWR